ncbi:uncharacterized protein LOC119690012 [Teleopsis dalmanni]|uniref:uncharacterized protein LOC119690012 n=1 Tax=Teleopsis dalmanni TaxID=139649 RepID=UPI0018CF0C77|nr:uncharacterized protein LOC119690012 [Teleopsis dalmanni]XP_037960912.1 uncharacterized protein LOC119690012 [Teleopsis dalmanni]
MDPPKIIDLESVIEPHLNGDQILSYTSRYLTKPGENYGSIMLSVRATIKRKNGNIEELPLIAKLPPLTNDFYWNIFQPERTCITENAVYKYAKPMIRQLQVGAGIKENEIFDCFPHYYGSRISLNPEATVVDRDAVLVQENVQISGFKAGNRKQAFDLAHTVLVLKNMAQFHALPIALRIKKPEDYEKYVRPYFHRFNINESMAPEARAEMNEETYKEVERSTNNNEKTVARVRKLMEIYDDFLAGPNKKDGLFTTIMHNDMWINNLMVQYDKDGHPSQLKIIDFQIAQYDSLVHDIIFFLFSSVDTKILSECYYEFLQLYYSTFIETLEKLHVSTTQYSYDLFLAEVNGLGHIQIPHALFMTKIILADSSTLPEDFKDLDISIFNKNSGVAEISNKTKDILTLAEKFNIF